MKDLNPPVTVKELQDLKAAIREHITQEEFVANQEWFERWGTYLIGLRRAYQKRFYAEAYNERSPGA